MADVKKKKELSPDEISNLEDGMISAKCPVIFAKEFASNVAELMKVLKTDPDNIVMEASTGFAIIYARKMLPCVVVASANENNDVIRILTLMKSLHEEIRVSKFIKVIIVTKFKQQAILDKFKLYGAYEILTEPISQKSLEFKVKIHTSAMRARRDRKSVV